MSLTLLAVQPQACCAVAGAGIEVIFKGQRNIIVWEPDSKTEHFIRRASFSTSGKDLGFIAPTPSLPKLVEVSYKAFDAVDSAMKRYMAAIIKKSIFSIDIGCGAKGEDKGAGGSVQVLQTKEVAGYTATTLKANDSKALYAWLTKNGYTTNPSIDEWLAYYIKKDWFLTAFKVSASNGEGNTGLVRMTFQTDKPFNPYYVPKSNKREGSWSPDGLKVSFIAPAEYRTVGTFELRREIALPMVNSDINDLTVHLDLDSLPHNLALTSFVDRSFPYSTGKEDVFFEEFGPIPDWPRDPDWWLPWFGAGVVGIMAYRAWRRKANFPAVKSD
ncbi:MAG: DUF2330 domain-containing protein [Armatimonadetes bacterium]|nr:DUF2330 domain-containing protein [Armatimonadota bacterium]